MKYNGTNYVIGNFDYLEPVYGRFFLKCTPASCHPPDIFYKLCIYCICKENAGPRTNFIGEKINNRVHPVSAIRDIFTVITPAAVCYYYCFDSIKLASFQKHCHSRQFFLQLATQFYSIHRECSIAKTVAKCNEDPYLPISHL